jgi:hypothetical protein
MLCLSVSSQKPNDYVSAKFNNPTLGAAAFKYAEFTPENTQFLAKDWYRNKKKVIERFTINGKFDEQLWNRFFELLTAEWFRFCYWSYEENAALEVVYDSNDYTSPANQKVIYCNGFTFWKKIK